MDLKKTTVSYCGECHRDFDKPEVVWYAPIENNCFCRDCKLKLNIKEWSPRLYGGEGE
ncbi:hypothetical protein [Sporosarcina sp. FSL K6-1508]|uniref:hypothetical protein n=1 Tax=Sporosarcina sp. FSL K6-1508 TaxID=2921553 RepID=UPI0030F5BAEA